MEFLGNLLKLVLILLGIYSEEKDRAKIEEREFKLSEGVFDAMVQRALQKMRDDAKAESGQAGKIEDQVDAELGKRK